MSQYAIKGSITCDFKRINELINELGGKYAKQDVTAAAKKVWTKIQKIAQDKVPKDSGHLRDMITLKSGFNTKERAVYATVGLKKIRAKERRRIRKRNAARAFQASVGYAVKPPDAEYDAYYGVFVEFGAPGHPGPQKAQPFLRPAFDENFRHALDEFTKELTARLEKRFLKLNQAPTRRIK